MNGEDRRDTCEAERRPDSSDQKQFLSPNSVDNRHGDDGEYQVCRADGDCLQIARHLAETSASKDVVEVIENRVDAGELIEGSDRNREEDRQGITLLEQRFPSKLFCL